MLDLKTCVSAEYHAFQRSLATYRYYVQAAFYLDGATEATGEPHKDFIFIAVEKSPPFSVALYTLDKGSVEFGRQAYLADLNRLCDYRENPELWPGYPCEIREMLLPNWAI